MTEKNLRFWCCESKKVDLKSMKMYYNDREEFWGLFLGMKCGF